MPASGQLEEYYIGDRDSHNAPPTLSLDLLGVEARASPGQIGVPERGPANTSAPEVMSPSNQREIMAVEVPVPSHGNVFGAVEQGSDPSSMMRIDRCRDT